MPSYEPAPHEPCPCRSGGAYRRCCARIAPLVERAMRLCGAGKYAEALGVLEESESDSVELLGRRATVLRLLGQNERFDELIGEALSRNPEYPRGLYLRAVSSMERNDWGAAALDLRKCESLLPPADHERRAEALTNLGVCLFNAGDIPGARDAWGTALRCRPDDDLARLNLLMLLGDHSGIRDAVTAEFAVEEPGDRAVIEAEREIRAIFSRAVAAQKAGRPADAIALYEELLERDPGSADSAMNLGICCLDIGDRRGALSAFRRFLALEPSSRDAVRIRKLLQSLR